LKRDIVYLKHIQEAITRIESYVSVGRTVFMTTSHWQDAVIRQLEIIGEAAKKISEELRTKHVDIPWRRISGMRDVLIHPPTQDTTALTVEECVIPGGSSPTYPNFASADFAYRQMTPRSLGVGGYGFGGPRACPWGSMITWGLI